MIILRWHLLVCALFFAFPHCTFARPLRNLAVGDKAFSIDLKDDTGKIHRLSELKGTPAVIVFWRPEQELSHRLLGVIDSLAARFAKEGTAFLSIIHKPLPKGGFPENPLNSEIKILLDPDRIAYGTYGVFAQPTTIILDKDHKVFSLYASYRRGINETIEDDLRKVLGLEARKIKKKPKDILDPQKQTVNFARKLLKAGDVTGALALLEKTTPPKPSTDRVLIISEALIRLDRAKEARPKLEKLLLVDPKKPRTASIPNTIPLGKGKWAATLLGRAIMETDEFELAEAWLKEAITMNPNPLRARFHLGELYEKAGRKDEALLQYTTILKRTFKY